MRPDKTERIPLPDAFVNNIAKVRFIIEHEEEQKKKVMQSLINIVRKIKTSYKNLNTIEKKMYWTMVPAGILIGILACIIIILCGQGLASVLTTILCILLNSLNLIFVYFSGKVRQGYVIFTLYTGVLIFPLMFFMCGGFYSGMPIFCLSGILLSGFCHNKRTRYITGFINLAATLATFIVAMCCDYLVRDLPEVSRQTDIFLSLFLLSVGLVFAMDLAFGEYKQFMDKMSKLAKHMDSRIIPMINGIEGDGSGEEMNIAIMFADIVGFTTLSENMTPAMSAAYLNVFFNISEKCIHKYDGIIDKYIGDCVMCYWIDDGKVNPVELACRAANEIIVNVKKELEGIYSKFKCEMKVSCGINYGTAIVGEIGSKSRLDFTVIGDVINIASRLENLAPSNVIYLSQDAAIKVEEVFPLSKIKKKVVLKGKNSPVDIYTLKSIDEKGEKLSIPLPENTTGFALHICGSRGSYSLAGNRYQDYGGETSCYIFKKDNYALIVDCGTGLQKGREILEDCKTIDIILTHVHYDHVIGLLDWSIFPSGVTPTFYGNFSEWLGEKTISELFRPPFWPVDLSCGSSVSVKRFFEYKLNSDVSVTFYPASHPNGANLPVIKLCGRKICIMADCENPNDLPLNVLQDCDILMYDGMYEEAYYQEHIGWGHSTWESGVALAQKAKVKRLIITHHNPRNSDEKLHGLELAAQNLFPSTTFAKAGEKYII